MPLFYGIHSASCRLSICFVSKKNYTKYTSSPLLKCESFHLQKRHFVGILPFLQAKNSHFFIPKCRLMCISVILAVKKIVFQTGTRSVLLHVKLNKLYQKFNLNTSQLCQN
jgi:hypothetical protein